MIEASKKIPKFFIEFKFFLTVNLFQEPENAAGPLSPITCCPGMKCTQYIKFSSKSLIFKKQEKLAISLDAHLLEGKRLIK